VKEGSLVVESRIRAQNRMRLVEQRQLHHGTTTVLWMQTIADEIE